jgi:hypothetical protein
MRREIVWMGIAASTLLTGACGDDSGGGTTSATTTSSTTSTSSGDGGTGPAGSGGGGNGPVGSGGAGGGPDLDKDPATVTDPEECWYEGTGGDNGYTCNAAVVELSDPIPLAEMTFSIETSLGTTFDGECVDDGSPCFVPDADPVTALTLVNDPAGVIANEHYAPEWLDVEVRRNDVLVGAERFEPLEYACIATGSDWCWESEPVTLEVTNPE